ncbi:hypothetical protein T492DRAFT_969669 [Pavlovales sp. CCMP2436]|nr:hypothetical protein T492DRAFT_969669 [Pavlovales sp. CCMP2436]|mmetsp:Transcript_24008/g.57037  ORF Transcript_24008/g.57037 Transcript_24008/m.57037 type:complete len:179 (+) Transcript_24008:3-539(+)
MGGKSEEEMRRITMEFLAGFDGLTLAGLLNALDGVVDSPGRLLVMTTNYPEKLDPALIRPGRIDKIIYLGHVRSRQAAKMIRHYFGQASVSPAHMSGLARLLDGKGGEGGGAGGASLASRQSSAVPKGAVPAGPEEGGRSAYGTLDLTPAQLEQQCAEQDSVEGLLLALERMRAQAGR